MSNNVRVNAAIIGNLSPPIKYVMASRSDTPTSEPVASSPIFESATAAVARRSVASRNMSPRESYENDLGETFYHVIGTMKGASIETIENGYRDSASKLYREDSEDAIEQVKMLWHAFSVLKNDMRRIR